MIIEGVPSVLVSRPNDSRGDLWDACAKAFKDFNVRSGTDPDGVHVFKWQGWSWFDGGEYARQSRDSTLTFTLADAAACAVELTRTELDATKKSLGEQIDRCKETADRLRKQLEDAWTERETLVAGRNKAVERVYELEKEFKNWRAVAPSSFSATAEGSGPLPGRSDDGSWVTRAVEKELEGMRRKFDKRVSDTPGMTDREEFLAKEIAELKVRMKAWEK